MKQKVEIVSASMLSKVVSLQIWNIKKEKDREGEKVGDRRAKLNEKNSER